MFSYGVFFVLLVATFVNDGSCNASTEANALALEAAGKLLAPKPLALKFEKELKAIRDAYPAVRNIVYAAPWVPGVLLAQVSDDQLVKIQKQYGDVTAVPMFDEYKQLTFKTQYNPVALGKELTAKKLVTSADADFIIGASNGIKYDAQFGVYTFHQGSGDCPAGCIDNHYWDFYVLPSYNKAILLKEYGTSPESLAF